MKKFILKLVLQDEKDKRKAMKIVSALPGIDEISIDMKGQKLTIIGTVDPVGVVSKLRKFWPTHIILVGPAKEEKKEEPKKEEPKKEEPKKEEAAAKEEPKKEEAAAGKKEEEPKKEEPKKVAPEQPPHPVIGIMPYRPYYPPMQTYYYANHSMEENPNACVIC